MVATYGDYELSPRSDGDDRLVAARVDASRPDGGVLQAAGDPLSGSEEEGEGGKGKAGEKPGDHSLEVEVTLAKQRESVATTQSVKMRKATPPSEGRTEPSKPPKKGVQREGVMDPFANP